MPPRLLHPIEILLAAAAALLVGCTSASDPGATMTGEPRATSPRPAAAPPDPAVPARNAYVLLSGGGTPLTNNYSQYLQAKAIAAFFQRECPPESTWVFFGTGNRDGTVPVLADTRRQVKRDGLAVESWLPGVLPNNRPATRESFLRALREEILPAVRGGGTLYLFVGDHGEVAGRGEQRESVITLWQMKRRRRSGDWFTDEREVLGVAELRRILAEGLGEGRVVFCMTQCHSGGFHELAVAGEIKPPRGWLIARPPWATAPPERRRPLRIAGFTATDMESPAAGCEPDPEPERWAGYERFFPEKLFGVDLMTGGATGPGVRTLADAHEAATLVDRTIDKPRGTSDHFLAAWAKTIETRLTNTPLLTGKTGRAAAAFHHSVETGRFSAADVEFRARQAQFARFTEQLARDVPLAAELLLAGTRPQLEQAIRARGDRRGGRGVSRAALVELRRAWSETLRPAWKAAVLRGDVPGLEGAALAFEKQLLELEEGGRDFLLPRGGDDTPLLNEVYWASGYAEPAKLELEKAGAITGWAAARRRNIVDWGRRAADPAVRAVAEKIGPGPGAVEETLRPLTRRTAAERVLFYRRVLAAWEFLLTMEAVEPLADLQMLVELERTPLRPESP